jgi:divalent metal cation (Fe/Co/Zn/Cd) transporter
LTAHNVQILWVDDGYILEFDIEYPEGTSFLTAHTLANEVEERIRGAVPAVRVVNIHLEEEQNSALHGDDTTSDETTLVQRITELFDRSPAVQSMTELRCHTTRDGLKISAAITLPSAMTLREMHAIVDNIEGDIKKLDSRIDTVFIRAAPRV